MNNNVLQTAIATSTGVGVASLFAYFGWLGVTVNTISKDIIEIKTDLKHLTKRVESVESHLEASFKKDFSNMEIASEVEDISGERTF